MAHTEVFAADEVAIVHVMNRRYSEFFSAAVVLALAVTGNDSERLTRRDVEYRKSLI